VQRRIARALAAAAAAALGAVGLRRVRTAEAEQKAAAERVEHARAEVKRLRQQLGRQRELIERLQRSRRAERDWNQELRDQLQRVHAARGPLADAEDVRELVLRAAIELVAAEKGLLLSREDADSDGDLDMVCAYGFENDPEHSAIAQRFAREVLARDRIVREDEPQLDGREPSAADREIDNLVAIPFYLMDRFQGAVVCANRDGGFEALDDDLLLALGDHAGAALHMQRLRNELNDSYRAAVRMLADALEARDPLLRRQAGEAAMLARGLCRRLGLDAREQEVVATAMLVRDVGHVGVPERILLKPGPLLPEERSIVEVHPRVGSALIGELPALRDVAAAVLYHHERYDGTGYPVGLAGPAIPRTARIISVVDAYSAMIHDRPHRPALPPERALNEVTAGAGTQFDPEVAGALLNELEAVGDGGHAELADAVASALDTGGLTARRDDVPAHDPLTLLPGHRAFREAAAAAAADGGLMVAIVRLEGLDALNRDEGYREGDRAILAAARNAQAAAVRFGGTVYRDSGRRLAILVTGAATAHQPDLAAELHTEFTLGPEVKIGVAAGRPGETGHEVIGRARTALDAAIMPPRRSA
jgi:HD-GYP domain-containing protein (c-di-GMP phosphodiesterase class II)/GGDEF domain-containing protein